MGPEWIAGLGLAYGALVLGAAGLGWAARGRAARAREELWEERHDQVLAQVADLLEQGEAGAAAAGSLVEVERRVLAARSVRDPGKRLGLLFGGGSGAPPASPGTPPAGPAGGAPPTGEPLAP